MTDRDAISLQVKNLRRNGAIGAQYASGGGFA
jgi:hypothetical protein